MGPLLVLDSTGSPDQLRVAWSAHLDNVIREVYSMRPRSGDVGARGSVADSCDTSIGLSDPVQRSITVTTLTIVMTLILVLGLALEAVNGNGGGQGLAHALAVLKQGTTTEKLKALELLAELAGMQIMPALVQALRDDDGRVRAATQNVMWAIWLRSGNDQIDALLVEGIRLMEAEQYPEAVEVFDQVTARAPKFAEGYNKRATVYYLMLEFEKSIADIHKT